MASKPIAADHFVGGRNISESPTSGLDLASIMRSIVADAGGGDSQNVTPGGAACVAGDGVINAGPVVPPTTPSSQATGAGATVWNVNLPQVTAVVGGVESVLAAAADFNVVTAAPALANGQSRVADLVVKNVAGTLSVVAVLGAAATTGMQAAPTDAAIQAAAAVGAGVPWTRLARCTLNRTGDMTLTQSQRNGARTIYPSYTPVVTAP